ncbi:hypothetical protein IW261DRAFT_1473322 [Armillaria novae-zelandiae]|uniref:C2H2-type domain-containing protein n=1 Tax=Armillaria novae-zelandiae TaxID=153914 RepID=A0AA39PAE7_9AGAR|nr:hypothetical protein IW261DRAFT_1473322 [Armillaria novae-zelandiae]
MVHSKLRIRCYVLGCKVPISRKADIPRHLKTHTKAEKDFLYCSGCPYRAIQLQNLEKHTKNHHSGNERYKCKDPSGCEFGANSKGAITKHRGKCHKQVPPSTLDVIMNPTEPVYGRESTVESSSSSLSYTSASPATCFEEILLEECSPSSLLRPLPVGMGPAPCVTSVSSRAVATGMEQFHCAPVEATLQHGDERVIHDPKVLYRATDVYPPSSLDIRSDDVLPQRGCSPPNAGGSSGTISPFCMGAMYSYDSVMDVAASSSTLDDIFSVHAPDNPFGYQQDFRQVHPAPLPHLLSAYSGPDPVGSITNAGILNTLFPAYNGAGPSGYHYQPQRDSTLPVQHSAPSCAYPESLQTYQTASRNGLDFSTPQQLKDNALFTALEQLPWMSDFSMRPSPNNINGNSVYEFPPYAYEPSSNGAYEGYRYHSSSSEAEVGALLG